MSPEQGTLQTYNLLYVDVGYIPVDHANLDTTPRAPLNHSGVCLCDLMFGQVGVTSGSRSATVGGVFPDLSLRPKSPLRLSFQ